MKKFIFVILSVMLLFLVGCADPVNNNTNEEDVLTEEEKAQIEQQERLQKKLEAYTRNLGTWEIKGKPNPKQNQSAKVELAMNYIALDDVVYSFNPMTDLYLEDELPVEWQNEWGWGFDFLFRVNGMYIGFVDYIYNKGYNFVFISFPYYFGSDYTDDSTLWGNDFAAMSFVRISGGGNSASGSTAVNGDYQFTNASNYQANGVITLKDGTWSYNGDKYNAAATEGTYTVSGNTITFSWTANGYEVSETITVSTSGTSSTWTSNGYTFFSMLFGVFGQEMTFDYTE